MPSDPPTAPVATATTAFGRAMLAHWQLDPGVLYLNHGTVGAVPRRVLEAQRKIRDEIELQPSRFLLRELTAIQSGAGPAKPRMRVAADAVASFVGARGEDLVFVDNTTTGVNAVLGSIDFREGDEILVLDLTYGAVANTARYMTRRRGATVRTLETPYPIDPGAMVRTVLGGIGPRTRVAIMDHITSESALLLPLAEIATECRARGVRVLADGAHAPGAIALDIPALGVDWYVGNLHKWAYSPRSSGILWTAAKHQAEIHPHVISWGLDQGYTTEFDLVGTRDPSAHLAAPEGIVLMRELGVGAVQSYNHRLAWEAAHLLARHWNTSLGMPETMIGTMATVPLPDHAGSDRAAAVRLRDGLLYEDGIEVQIHPWRGRLWVRISAQVYNEIADYERLARAITARIGAGF